MYYLNNKSYKITHRDNYIMIGITPPADKLLVISKLPHEKCLEDGCIVNRDLQEIPRSFSQKKLLKTSCKDCETKAAVVYSFPWKQKKQKNFIQSPTEIGDEGARCYMCWETLIRKTFLNTKDISKAVGVFNLKHDES